MINLPNSLKGALLILVGVLVLLYALGIVGTFFNIMVIFAAIGLIFYGTVKSGLAEKLMSLVKKR